MSARRRRELRILAAYCVAGAAALGALAVSGLVVPATLWTTVAGVGLGGWVGLAVYRLRADSLV